MCPCTEYRTESDYSFFLFRPCPIRAKFRVKSWSSSASCWLTYGMRSENWRVYTRPGWWVPRGEGPEEAMVLRCPHPSSSSKVCCPVLVVSCPTWCELNCFRQMDGRVSSYFSCFGVGLNCCLYGPIIHLPLFVACPCWGGGGAHGCLTGGYWDIVGHE